MTKNFRREIYKYMRPKVMEIMDPDPETFMKNWGLGVIQEEFESFFEGCSHVEEAESDDSGEIIDGHEERLGDYEYFEF